MTGSAQAPLWREVNAGIFGQTVAAAAERLGILELAVDKDYWVCQALRAIEAHAPGETIFKGGTSLQKMRLIDRFSEDLDLLVPNDYGGPRPTKRALNRMCEVAAEALPGCESVCVRSGGNPGSMHRAVYLAAPLAGRRSTSGIADPGRILLELGQSGGQHPSVRRPVVSLLARALDEAGVAITDFPDLAPFDVRMLHPGRTLIEKLLRVNNFAADELRREQPQGWSRIGRQFYDVWALLGSTEVRDLLADRDRTAEIVADCTRISESFAPDLPPPVGGFAACPAFDPNWPEQPRLRAEHETAMRDLYYGRTPGPTFDDVVARIHRHRELLDFTSE